MRSSYMAYVLVWTAAALLSAPAWAQVGSPNIDDEAEFGVAEIYVIVAKRSAVAGDDGKKAVHLFGLARAQRDVDDDNGPVLRIEDDDEESGGFIDLEQRNPGKSKNTDIPSAFLREMTLVLSPNGNRFEGTSELILDTEGDGPDEGANQVIPVRVRVNHRANNNTNFLQGTFHNALDDAGTIGGESAEATDQPRINGRIRSDRK